MSLGRTKIGLGGNYFWGRDSGEYISLHVLYNFVDANLPYPDGWPK